MWINYSIIKYYNDVLKGNRQIYHINRVIKEMAEDFSDGSNIIYVNASITQDDDIGRLMHDFICKKPEDMYYKELSDKTREFKEEGGKKMSSALNKFLEESREEGIKEGINELIKTYKYEFNVPKEDVVNRVATKFNLLPNVASEYVDKYYS